MPDNIQVDRQTTISRKIMVTGGCGFIGSNLIRYILNESEHFVLNLDKLTYAGNLVSLDDIANNKRYRFEHADIGSPDDVERILRQFQPDWIMNLAAESHVDRSIDSADAFIDTNIVGTYKLLNATLGFYKTLDPQRKLDFRFHHISTDEVYGSLGFDEPAFTELTRYDPHSPYSASKASSDHLVRAWFETYKLPILITNCSNNYGPWQFPEKLIPVVILNAIHGKPIPVYGNGKNVRDWLYVEDHIRALMNVVEKGRLGETYNIGGNNELRNVELVRMLCSILDEEIPVAGNDGLTNVQQNKLSSYSDLIDYVTDRPGHDMRYAIDTKKIARELGWKPRETMETGLRQTVQWYLSNKEWWSQTLSCDQRLKRQGLER